MSRTDGLAWVKRSPKSGYAPPGGSQQRKSNLAGYRRQAGSIPPISEFLESLLYITIEIQENHDRVGHVQRQGLRRKAPNLALSRFPSRRERSRTSGSFSRTERMPRRSSR